MSIDPGPILLALARCAIARQLGQTCNSEFDATWLQAPGATFVTLTRGGELRGCIGTLEAHRPLLEDVQANAVAAALRDPRFAPLSLAEWADTRLEVSLLSASEPLLFDSEQQALAQLRPGIDGIILTDGRHRSTFLPQVWAQLPNPSTFLAHLKQKAGLAANAWSPSLQLARYTVRKWQEPTPHRQTEQSK